jgi:predicted Zn-dependent protease
LRYLIHFHVVEGCLTVADDLMANVLGCYMIEDAGYDSNAHRRMLESNNNIPVIPGRKNR